MRRIILAALLLAASATGALAGYVTNYSDWKQKSPFAQSQYAMGLLDGQMLTNAGDKIAIARSDGLDKCAYALGLTGEMIAEAITRYYQDHTDIWGASPMVPFQIVIVKGACLEYVNTERAKYSLPPWTK